ncbi:hypothetical protein BDP55DRAFT_641394 [Colletotrichum godetiae]|uniref:Uncharacterized protein n=1 Tax=Colletotrichum godetiae TaxID=1209918 RepID=A0AAJ0AZW3_9PEZI|nr:uncharacterized protein BDP55DRAFT_641394 [Colletotrichum godetiae]KAK1701381.1 hypothetical protein BDP55DRAFT_641394 [Colletotrichum godetiae]
MPTYSIFVRAMALSSPRILLCAAGEISHLQPPIPGTQWSKSANKDQGRKRGETRVPALEPFQPRASRAVFLGHRRWLRSTGHFLSN